MSSLIPFKPHEIQGYYEHHSRNGCIEKKAGWRAEIFHYLSDKGNDKFWNIRHRMLAYGCAFTEEELKDLQELRQYLDANHGNTSVCEEKVVAFRDEYLITPEIDEATDKLIESWRCDRGSGRDLW